MKHYLLLILSAIIVFTACNNDKTNETTQTNQDVSTTTPDTAINTTPGTNLPGPSSEITDTTSPLLPADTIRSSANKTSALNGSWELEFVAGSKTSFAALYPTKKPTINFDAASNTLNGNTGCNSFSGKLKADSNRINFSEPFVMTKMACPGEGENVFLQAIKKINKYTVADNKLTFRMSDNVLMRFKKQ